MRELDVRARSELPLPEGTFFNGVNYVDWDGNHSKWHPQVGQLADEFRRRKNEEAHAHNALAKERVDVARKGVSVWCSSGRL